MSRKKMRARKGQPIKIYVLGLEKKLATSLAICLAAFFSFSVLIEENIYKKEDSKYLKKKRKASKSDVREKRSMKKMVERKKVGTGSLSQRPTFSLKSDQVVIM